MMFQWLRQYCMLPVTLFGFGLQQHTKKRRLSSSRHDSLHQPFEIAVSKLLQYRHVKLFQYSISLLSRPNYKPGSANGTLVKKIVGDSKRGRRVEPATRASGIASHAPRIRPKIAAILACNIVTALSQCRHVRL